MCIILRGKGNLDYKTVINQEFISISQDGKMLLLMPFLIWPIFNFLLAIFHFIIYLFLSFIKLLILSKAACCN